MFIRLKKIKGNDYGYLVENEWTPNGPRQKVRQYLGRVHKPEKKYEKHSAFEPSFEKSVLAFLKNELLNHGFAVSECGNLLACEDIAINLAKNNVSKQGKPAVIALNEGFLCERALAELLAIKPPAAGSETSGETGTILAHALVSSGIKLSEEQFIKLFEQLTGSSQAF